MLCVGRKPRRVRAVPNAAVVSGWESDLRRVRQLQAIINSLGSAFRPSIAGLKTSVDWLLEANPLQSGRVPDCIR